MLAAVVDHVDRFLSLLTPFFLAGMLPVYNIRMSGETRELVDICERLRREQRAEVTDFARFLLAKQAGTGNGNDAPQREMAEKWLAGAPGVARPGVTTDQLLDLTRGEP